MTERELVQENERLHSRVQRLAEEKSYLQLIVRLIEQLNPLPGVEDMVAGMLRNIVETIGGTNIRIWYWVEDELHYADFLGHKAVVTNIDDAVAEQVRVNRQFLEEPGDASNSLMRGHVVPGACNWTFPLLVGEELIGIVKLENVHIIGEPLSAYLPIFFSHAALILSNEIRNTIMRRSEGDLRVATERLQLATEAGIIGIWDWDVDSDELFWDASMYRLYGKHEGEFDGAYAAWVSALHPEDKTYADGEIQAALRGEREYAPEFRVVWPDGSVHHIKAASKTFRDEAGKPLRMVGINYDQTELKRAEQERLTHLHFLESMDRINRAIQGGNDMREVLRAVLDKVLAIFNCDRSGLVYPCDPQAENWRIEMESARPGLVRDEDQTVFPMYAERAEDMRQLLLVDGPVRFGREGDLPLPETARQRFGIASMLSMAIRPRVGKAWEFSLHLCDHERVWSQEELRLFQEIGRRLGDALSSLLIQRNLSASELRLKEAEHIAHVGYWDRDMETGRVELSDEAYRIFGLPEDERVENLASWHQHWLRLIHPDDRPRVEGELENALAGRCRYDVEYRINRPDGEVRVIHSQADIPFDDTGKARRILGTMQDITERKQTEDSLRLAASVFAHSQEGIVITDASNRIVDVNVAFTLLTGYAREEVLGKSPHLLASGRHGRAFYDELWRSLKERSAWKGEIWNRRKNGEVFPEHLFINVVRDAAGKVMNYVGVFSDISQIKAHEAELDRVAHFDSLTGLSNRRRLAELMELAISRAMRSRHPLAVCYLDLDGFKPINDQYGHEVGDRLLIEIATRLKDELRSDDTVARLGGDEFVLLFNEIEDQTSVSRVLKRLLEKIAAPMLLDQHVVSVSASLGVTLCPQDDTDADRLLRHADQAMYLAKAEGKNRYHFYDAEQDRLAYAQRESLQQMVRALRGGELALYYQPKVNLVDGQVVGAEALLRWRHPERGVLAPGEFLHVIEGSDLDGELGDWVIETALGQIAKWNALGLVLTVSVNISAAHIQQLDFAHRLAEALARHPEVQSHQLELEILESSAFDDIDHVSRTLRDCLALGVHFALDDFGTGYSSLAYFRRLPVETLKIDQAFVRDMLDDPEDFGIVESVIRLAQAFNRPVIAEGVESIEHGAMLVHLGCRYGQGYGIARPMPEEQVHDWVHHWHGEAAWRDLDQRHLDSRDLVLMVAKASHRKWVDTVVAHLQSSEGGNPPDLSSHQCRFGRWCQGSGASRYGHLPEFLALHEPHEHIHDLAMELVSLIDQGQRQQAVARIAELHAARERVFDSLDRLVAQVRD